MLSDQSCQILFRVDWNSVGIETACQFGRIASSFNVGNLSGGESDNFVTLIVSEIDIEIVKIPPCGTHDDNVLDHGDTSMDSMVLGEQKEVSETDRLWGAVPKV